MFNFTVRPTLGLAEATLVSDDVQYLVGIGTSDCASTCGYWVQVRTEDTQHLWPGIKAHARNCLVRSDVWKMDDGFVITDVWTAW